MRRVSVVVPVKDRRERMLRCLDALLAQDHPDYEVLVCDNGSTDGTYEALLERAGDRVRVERVPGTVGQVRNHGARIARHDLIAFTDSDCLPEPGWLSAGVRPLDDPGVGIVCGRTLPEEPPTQGWPVTLEVTELTMRFESANVIVRRDALLGAGGFDEGVGYYWEDTAAGFALLRAGWRAAYAPDAVVRHDVTYPGFWWHVKRARAQENAGPVVRRHPEIRDRLLWARYFMGPRHAKLVAALAGVALAAVDRRALALAAPYAWERRPRAVSPDALKGSVQGVILDLATEAALARGSLRARTVVL